MTSTAYDGYTVVRKESLDIINQSSSAYDKAVITLSSLLLGYIFTFSAHFNIKITPCIIKLIFGSIFLSLASFWLDQLVASSYIKIAEEYYINGN